MLIVDPNARGGHSNFSCTFTSAYNSFSLLFAPRLSSFVVWCIVNIGIASRNSPQASGTGVPQTVIDNRVVVTVFRRSETGIQALRQRTVQQSRTLYADNTQALRIHLQDYLRV